MRFFLPLLVCFIFTSAPPAAAKDVLKGPVQAKVLRVIDGDTIDIQAQIWINQNIQTRVRLAGIDTPELRGRCAQEKALAQKAQVALVELIQSAEITLHNIHYGKYGGRVIADVTNDQGVNIAHILIQQGFARSYTGKKRTPWCP